MQTGICYGRCKEIFLEIYRPVSKKSILESEKFMDKLIKQRIIICFLFFLIQVFIPFIEQIVEILYPTCLETIARFLSILDRVTAVFGAALLGNILWLYRKNKR